MDIPNNDIQNYPFCKLQLVDKIALLNEPTNHNSVKVPKVVMPTLGTSVINSSLSYPILTAPPPSFPIQYLSGNKKLQRSSINC